jgi:hypothetical protein
MSRIAIETGLPAKPADRLALQLPCSPAFAAPSELLKALTRARQQAFGLSAWHQC